MTQRSRRNGDAGASVTLRPFRRSDLARVHELICRTIDRCYTGVYPDEAVAFFKRYHSKKNIAADARAGHTFVIEQRDRVIGVGALVRSTIKRVFVDPDQQHHGYGRLLIARLEEQARSSGTRAVNLDASLPSKRLYDFLGYQSGPLMTIPVGSGRVLEYYPMTKGLNRTTAHGSQAAEKRRVCP